MRGVSCLLALLWGTGSVRPASAADPNATPPNAGTSEKPVDPDAGTAQTILDARQKAVDDIRAGRPAPYYLLPPGTAGGSKPPSPSGSDKKK